jgi:hypothetical protein
VQTIIHGNTVKQYEVERLIHEANYNDFQLVDKYLGHSHPIVCAMQSKFTLGHDDSPKKLLL